MHSYRILPLLLMLWAASLQAQSPPDSGHRPGMAHLFQLHQRWQANGTPKLAPPNLPSRKVRTMAEWERAETLLLTWAEFPEILREIVRYAVDECEVIIITDDEDGVRSFLTDGQINLDNIQFAPYDFNSVWMRDYGPWTVYEEQVGAAGLADYTYNRLARTDDDLIPHHLANDLGLPVFNADDTPYQWINAGGNFLPDGHSVAWSSDLVLRENSGKTGMVLQEYARLFFGVEQYRILPRLPFDIIHHLDMHIFQPDEETLVIGQFPPGVGDAAQMEANVDWIRRHYRTPYGRPYRIIRMPMPPDFFGRYAPQSHYRTYTNALLLNKTLLVPQYSNPLDTVALGIYRALLPGYRVVGINCEGMIADAGAIHCVTKLMGVPNPVLFKHPRIREAFPSGNCYELSAEIYHTEGIQSAGVWYKTEQEADFSFMALQRVPNQPDAWVACLPEQPTGSRVTYYLTAVTHEGQTANWPQTAPQHGYTFEVKAYSNTLVPEVHCQNTHCAEGTAITFTDFTAGGITDRTWYFEGGEPSTSNLANPTVNFEQAGTYGVDFTCRNPQNEATRTFPNMLRVHPAIEELEEGFEHGYPANWYFENTPEERLAWEISLVPEPSHNIALQLPNFGVDSLLQRPSFRFGVDLRQLIQPVLRFDVAYANPFFQAFDELRVDLTDGNGQVFNIYNKGGAILASSNPSLQPFIPQHPGQWRRDSIKLSPWQGQRVLLTFTGISDGGNNLFLDNFQLVGEQLGTPTASTPSATAQLQVFPNPAYQQTPRATLLLPIAPKGLLQWSCTDALGRTAASGTLPAEELSNGTFALPDLPAGTYVLQVKWEQGGSAVAVYTVF